MCNGNEVILNPATLLVPNSLSVRSRLFCSDVYKHRVVWSLNTIGVGIGAAIFGTLSDRLVVIIKSD